MLRLNLPLNYLLPLTPCRYKLHTIFSNGPSPVVNRLTVLRININPGHGVTARLELSHPVPTVHLHPRFLCHTPDTCREYLVGSALIHESPLYESVPSSDRAGNRRWWVLCRRTVKDKMGHIMRKHVFAICEQQRCRSAWASAQSVV